MRKLSFFLVVVCMLLCVRTEAVSGRVSSFEESFESGKFDTHLWKIPRARTGVRKIIEGKLYLSKSGEYSIGIATKAKYSYADKYMLEFDFYPLSKEKKGYGIGVAHQRPEKGDYWRIGFSGE